MNKIAILKEIIKKFSKNPNSQHINYAAKYIWMNSILSEAGYQVTKKNLCVAYIKLPRGVALNQFL